MEKTSAVASSSLISRLDRRGVAAIEFAILAIPLLLLIMGGIELGFMMFCKAQLGGVLQQAARMATTGNAQTNGLGGEKIDAMVKAQLKVTGDATVDVEKSYYDSFNQVRKPEVKDNANSSPPYCWIDVNGNSRWDTDPFRTGLGGANDIINYKVVLKYPVLFPLLTKTATGFSDIKLEGQAALQNEPFEGGQDQVQKRCCISAAAGNPVTCADI